MSRSERRWATVLTFLVLMPFVVAVYHLIFGVGDRYLPVGDWSLLEMRVRDVGHQWLTTGVYSRFGWYHPGPLLFFVLAVPYRLLGSHSVDVNVGAVLVGTASVVGSALVGWRRGGLPSVIAVLVPLALLVHSFGADQVQDPWNPYVSILPFFLFLLVAWSLSVGDRWMALPMVITMSFVIQSHVAYVVLCTPIAFLAIVGGVRAGKNSHRRLSQARGWPRIVGVSVTAAVVLWFPVLWGTFISDDGNLNAIRRFSTGSQPSAGFGTALRTVGLQWGVRPEWIVGSRRDQLTILPVIMEQYWWIAPGLAVLMLAGYAAWRSRDRELGWLVVIAAVGTAAGIVGVSRIVGPVVWYLVRWTWALGAFLGVVGLVALGRLLRISRRAAVITLIGSTALVSALSISSAVGAAKAQTPFAPDQARVRPAVDQVVRALPRRSGRVLIDIGRSDTSADFNIGLQLERRGYRVTVQPSLANRFGSERSQSRPHYVARLLIVGPLNNPEPPRGGRLIARSAGQYAVYLTHGSRAGAS